MTPTLKRALDLSFIHTEGAWRNPGSWVNYPYYTHPGIWEDVARVAERGCIDMVFFGDGVGIPDTWEGSIDAAVTGTGVLADPAKVHYLDHHGEFFDVKGPLNMLPSPQHHPPLIQAGASPRGLLSFARNADIVFVSRPSAAGMRTFRAELDRHLAEVGRAPEEIQVLWPVHPMMGENAEHGEGTGGTADRIGAVGGRRRLHGAQERLRLLHAAGHLHHRGGHRGNRSGQRIDGVSAQDGRDGGTRRSADQADVPAARPRDDDRGGPTLYGSGTDIADQICDLHAETGPNVGFMVSIINVMPRNVVDFVEKVVPIRAAARGVQDRLPARRNITGRVRIGQGPVCRSP